MLKDLENLSANIDLLISEKNKYQTKLSSLHQNYQFLEEETKNLRKIAENLKKENDLIRGERDILKEKILYTQKQLSYILESLLRSHEENQNIPKT